MKPKLNIRQNSYFQNYGQKPNFVCEELFNIEQTEEFQQDDQPDQPQYETYYDTNEPECDYYSDEQSKPNQNFQKGQNLDQGT